MQIDLLRHHSLQEVHFHPQVLEVDILSHPVGTEMDELFPKFFLWQLTHQRYET